MEYQKKALSLVLRKDDVPDCKTETQTLRRWFLKKRPVCPTSYGISPKNGYGLNSQYICL